MRWPSTEKWWWSAVETQMDGSCRFRESWGSWAANSKLTYIWTPSSRSYIVFALASSIFALMTSCIWTRAEKSRLCGFGRFHSGCCLFWNILGKFPHSVVYQPWRKRCQNKLLNHDLIYFAKVFLKSSKISVWNKPLKVRQEVNWIPFLGDSVILNLNSYFVSRVK